MVCAPSTAANESTAMETAILHKKVLRILLIIPILLVCGGNLCAVGLSRRRRLLWNQDNLLYKNPAVQSQALRASDYSPFSHE